MNEYDVKPDKVSNSTKPDPNLAQFTKANDETMKYGPVKWKGYIR